MTTHLHITIITFDRKEMNQQLSLEVALALKLHNLYRARKGLPPILVGDFIREDLEHKDHWDDRIGALTQYKRKVTT